MLISPLTVCVCSPLSSTVAPLRAHSKIGRGSLGVTDKNISRKQAVISILGDGATQVTAGGVNPIAVVRPDGQVIVLRKGGGSVRLLAGDTLEVDGFKRSDRAKFPNGPVHVFSIVACADDPPSPRAERQSNLPFRLPPHGSDVPPADDADADDIERL